MISERLFDLGASRQVLEYETELKRLAFHPDEVKAGIAEYSQQREQLRQGMKRPRTQRAANRSAQNIVRGGESPLMGCRETVIALREKPPRCFR